MNEKTETITFSELVEDIQKRVRDQSRLPKAICFDYFDTLVFRTVAPEQTKQLAAHQLSLLLGTLSGGALYEMRRELEGKLCRESAGQGKDPEFSLPGLAGRLYHLLHGMSQTIGSFSRENDFVHCFCNIELAVEKQVQRPYPEMLELLKWLKKRSVMTFLVSDFYIPQSYFETMIADQGFKDLFTETFISVDYGLSKGSGRLYPEICHKLGCAPADLWMIGDNIHADKAMAEQAGLKAILVDVAQQKARYERWQLEPQSEVDRKDCLVRNFDSIVLETENVYFREMGSSLWLFVTGLFARLYKDRVSDVFFCSKEGEFLKRLFALYQEKMFGGQLIACHYLVVSRKATFICSLQPLATETFARLFDQYRDLTLAEFILSLNFSKAELTDLQGQLACDWNVRLANLQQHDHFKALLGLPLFQVMYERHRREQRQNFLHYLGSFGVDFRTGGLHMVDVGWKGSIQNNIYFSLDESVHVHGYYLGLLTPSGVNDKNSKTGILFSDCPNLTPFIHVYNNNRSLFEMVLGASHGSADGYFTTEQYAAVHDVRRSTSITSAKGQAAVEVSVLDLPEERRLFDEKIVPLQRAYVAMFEKLTDAMMYHHCPEPGLEWFAKHHARMLFRPTQGEVDFFAGLYHLENFGLFEFTAFSTSGQVQTLQRLRNFLELWRNPARLLETGVWPPIVLRRLGLSWLQPIDGMKRYRRIFKEQ